MSGNGQQGDTLLFDMSQSTEGTPQIFVRRDWLSILDNMNQSYIGNQSIIDTSQLANSNKYMSYYEATLIVPLLLTMTSVTNGATGFTTGNYDYVMGLKNWLGTIVHSFTLDYNGTTIIQQTPFVGLWNTFCLMTSFNYNDFTEWASIGFYPDTSTSWSYSALVAGGATFTEEGVGITNNQNQLALVSPVGILGQTSTGNIGFYKRQQYFAFDGVSANTPNGGNVPLIGTSGNTNGLVPVSLLNNSYKSYIFNKVNGGVGSVGVLQQAIIGQIKLRHLHNFFQEVPLLKGVFMKMTMNLNNTSFTLGITNGTGWVGIGNVVCPLGGVNPLMIASASGTNGASTLASNSYNFSIAVGAKVLSSSQTTVTGIGQSPMLGSVMLNIPSYVYNPIYEQAYLSSSVKTIVYNDLYQYQVLNVQPGQTFNNLITNGISGIQTVLVLPFYSVGTASITTTGGSTSTTGNQGISPIQSPFTTEGGGTTSPLCLLGNFNVVISGQNAIYNTERFTYEQFTQQLYGLNATNGGLTDGVNSGLVNQMDFENMYNYYAVNVSRMLPIEEAVPKSVNIIGTNLTNVALDLYVFVNYKTSVSIDILTGSRV
jgi:hypothetical protein